MYIPWEWIRERVNCGSNYSVGKFIEQLNYQGLECGQSSSGGILFINFTVAHNRQDLRSWWGLAGEVSVLLDLRVNTGSRGREAGKDNYPGALVGNLQFIVRSKKVTECSIVSLSNLVRNKGLPTWISQSLVKNRLGISNSIVDIINLTTLETGQLLSVFDLEKLRRISSGQEVVIRERKTGGVPGGSRRAVPGDLLVETNGRVIKPSAVSGKDSMNTEQPIVDILVISASFLTSSGEESRRRLESGVVGSEPPSNSNKQGGAKSATRRFRELTASFYNYQEHRTKNFLFPLAKKTTCRKITISMDFLEQKLGVALPQEKIETILKRLNFSFTSSNNFYTIEVPNFRADIRIGEDLLEEIGKLLDYNLLPGRLPTFQNQFIDLHFNDFHQLRRRIALYLMGGGYQEVLSYSLVEDSQGGDNKVFLTNPRSSLHAVYRGSFLDSHLKIVRHNQGQGRGDLFLFEIGDVYSRKDNSAVPSPEQILSVFATGKIVNLQVHRFTEEVDIYWMKGLLENLLAIMSIDNYIIGRRELTSAGDLNYPLLIDGERMGFIRQFSPQTLAESKVRNTPSFGLQLSFSKLFPLLDKQEGKKYTPVSYLPVVTKNISFLIAKNISPSQIIELIRREGGAFLLDVLLVDIYDKETESSLHSLNFQLSFQGRGRNLQNTEIEMQIERIWKVLVGEFSVLRR